MLLKRQLFFLFTVVASQCCTTIGRRTNGIADSPWSSPEMAQSFLNSFNRALEQSSDFPPEKQYGIGEGLFNAMQIVHESEISTSSKLQAMDVALASSMAKMIVAQGEGDSQSKVKVVAQALGEAYSTAVGHDSKKFVNEIMNLINLLAQEKILQNEDESDSGRSDDGNKQSVDRKISSEDVEDIETRKVITTNNDNEQITDVSTRSDGYNVEGITINGGTESYFKDVDKDGSDEAQVESTGNHGGETEETRAIRTERGESKSENQVEDYKGTVGISESSPGEDKGPDTIEAGETTIATLHHSSKDFNKIPDNTLSHVKNDVLPTAQVVPQNSNFDSKINLINEISSAMSAVPTESSPTVHKPTSITNELNEQRIFDQPSSTGQTDPTLITRQSSGSGTPYHSTNNSPQYGTDYSESLERSLLGQDESSLTKSSSSSTTLASSTNVSPITSPHTGPIDKDVSSHVLRSSGVSTSLRPTSSSPQIGHPYLETLGSSSFGQDDSSLTKSSEYATSFVSPTNSPQISGAPYSKSFAQHDSSYTTRSSGSGMPFHRSQNGQGETPYSTTLEQTSDGPHITKATEFVTSLQSTGSESQGSNPIRKIYPYVSHSQKDELSKAQVAPDNSNIDSKINLINEISSAVSAVPIGSSSSSTAHKPPIANVFKEPSILDQSSSIGHSDFTLARQSSGSDTSFHSTRNSPQDAYTSDTPYSESFKSSLFGQNDSSLTKSSSSSTSSIRSSNIPKRGDSFPSFPHSKTLPSFGQAQGDSSFVKSSGSSTTLASSSNSPQSNSLYPGSMGKDDNSYIAKSLGSSATLHSAQRGHLYPKTAESSSFGQDDSSLTKSSGSATSFAIPSKGPQSSTPYSKTSEKSFSKHDSSYTTRSSGSGIPFHRSHNEQGDTPYSKMFENSSKSPEISRSSEIVTTLHDSTNSNSEGISPHSETLGSPFYGRDEPTLIAISGSVTSERSNSPKSGTLKSSLGQDDYKSFQSTNSGQIGDSFSDLPFSKIKSTLSQGDSSLTKSSGSSTTLARPNSSLQSGNPYLGTLEKSDSDDSSYATKSLESNISLHGKRSDQRGSLPHSGTIEKSPYGESHSSLPQSSESTTPVSSIIELQNVFPHSGTLSAFSQRESSYIPITSGFSIPFHSIGSSKKNGHPYSETLEKSSAGQDDSSLTRITPFVHKNSQHDSPHSRTGHRQYDSSQTTRSSGFATSSYGAGNSQRSISPNLRTLEKSFNGHQNHDDSLRTWSSESSAPIAIKSSGRRSGPYSKISQTFYGRNHFPYGTSKQSLDSVTSSYSRSSSQQGPILSGTLGKAFSQDDSSYITRSIGSPTPLHSSSGSQGSYPHSGILKKSSHTRDYSPHLNTASKTATSLRIGHHHLGTLKQFSPGVEYSPHLNTEPGHEKSLPISSGPQSPHLGTLGAPLMSGPQSVYPLGIMEKSSNGQGSSSSLTRSPSSYTSMESTNSGRHNGSPYLGTLERSFHNQDSSPYMTRSSASDSATFLKNTNSGDQSGPQYSKTLGKFSYDESDSRNSILPRSHISSHIRSHQGDFKHSKTERTSHDSSSAPIEAHRRPTLNTISNYQPARNTFWKRANEVATERSAKSFPGSKIHSTGIDNDFGTLEHVSSNRLHNTGINEFGNNDRRNAQLPTNAPPSTTSSASSETIVSPILSSDSVQAASHVTTLAKKVSSFIAKNGYFSFSSFSNALEANADNIRAKNTRMSSIEIMVEVLMEAAVAILLLMLGSPITEESSRALTNAFASSVTAVFG